MENYLFLVGVIAINGQGAHPKSPYMDYWNNVKALPKTSSLPLDMTLPSALEKLIPILSQLPKDLSRISSSQGE